MQFTRDTEMNVADRLGKRPPADRIVPVYMNSNAFRLSCIFYKQLYSYELTANYTIKIKQEMGP